MSGKTLWERHLSKETCFVQARKQAMKLLKRKEEERTPPVDEIASAQALMEKKKKACVCGISEE